MRLFGSFLNTVLTVNGSDAKFDFGQVPREAEGGFEAFLHLYYLHLVAAEKACEARAEDQLTSMLT